MCTFTICGKSGLNNAGVCRLMTGLADSWCWCSETSNSNLHSMESVYPKELYFLQQVFIPEQNIKFCLQLVNEYLNIVCFQGQLSIIQPVCLPNYVPNYHISLPDCHELSYGYLRLFSQDKCVDRIGSLFTYYQCCPRTLEINLYVSVTGIFFCCSVNDCPLLETNSEVAWHCCSASTTASWEERDCLLLYICMCEYSVREEGWVCKETDLYTGNGISQQSALVYFDLFGMLPLLDSEEADGKQGRDMQQRSQLEPNRHQLRPCGMRCNHSATNELQHWFIITMTTIFLQLVLVV